MADSNDIRNGVRAVMQDLYDETGEVRPSALVDRARPKESPAHRGFEWRDKVAAEQHRLWQARQWARKIEIRREPASEPERLVNVPQIEYGDKDREGRYKPISVVVSKPDEFEMALEQAQAKLDAAKRAMNELYSAAEKLEKHDAAAVIAQMARATAMWKDALSAMH